MPDGLAAPGDAASTGAASADLPSWDLSDLYPALDLPELAQALDAAEQDAKAFAAAHAGRLAALSGADAGRRDCRLRDASRKCWAGSMSYAQLLFSGDSNDPGIGRFYQSMNERVTAISTPLIFFTLELNRLDDADARRQAG